jgi:hypothetical protein
VKHPAAEIIVFFIDHRLGVIKKHAFSDEDGPNGLAMKKA